MSENKILVVDDDESVLWVVQKALDHLGYEVASEKTMSNAKKSIPKYNVILLDMFLPDGNGLDLLREIKSTNPNALVIIITANSKMENAINAMKEGAYDYLEKPFDIDELTITVQRAFNDLKLRQEISQLRNKVIEKSSPQIVGKSKTMLKLFKEIGRIASKDVTVLISGESGSGKELVARAIHNNSLRKFNSFVAINCASIPKELIEAELFGWEKGAFTGAHEKRSGLIHTAMQGTLFLDELSELDINLQAKLLRFLQGQEYTPLGSDKSIKADVRIIGATNKDLRHCVKEGTFREDLYYRFNVIEVKVPSLRERQDDIIPLARHFLEESFRLFNLSPKEFSKDALKALTQYNWPGNVRELENKIKRASILSKGSIIEKKDLFYEEHSFNSIKDFLEGKLNGFIHKMVNLENLNLYDSVIQEVEKALFSIVLTQTEGNQLKASKILGINRNTLNKKIKQYKMNY
ncbi:MAG TPA: sigma-54-dependent Fis family transcriptional regulator [Nitrospirae bacterium]|nr:sigma-54-dependent Fis family transcriptional regulator [Nitrospirota bacterium]